MNAEPLYKAIVPTARLHSSSLSLSLFLVSEMQKIKLFVCLSACMRARHQASEET